MITYRNSWRAAAALASALVLAAGPTAPDAQPAGGTKRPATAPAATTRRPASATPRAASTRAARTPRAAGALALPRVEKTKLANGLTVILAPDSTASAADVAVWYRAGSAWEPPGMSGVTHLFERLMFHTGAGSAVSDYRRRLSAEGAVVNTFTSPDFTSFFATVPSEAVELAIRLEAERMGRLDVDAAALAAERDFVRQERRQFVAANPIGRGVELLFATAFPGHGYGRPVLGLDEDLAQIGLAEVRAYHRDRYAPSNAVVTVAGRFDPVVARTAIASAFGALPGRGMAASGLGRPGAAPAAPQPRAGDRVDARFAIVLAGWRGPAATDPLATAFEALSDIVSGGAGSRLNRAAASGAARLLQVRGGVDLRRDASLLYAWGVVGAHEDSAAAESSLVRTVQALARDPVPEAELARTRRNLELAWLSERQTVRGRARAIGMDEMIAGDPASGARRIEAIRALTPAQIRLAAQRALRPENRTVVWLMPARAGGEGGR